MKNTLWSELIAISGQETQLVSFTLCSQHIEKERNLENDDVHLKVACQEKNTTLWYLPASQVD